MAKITREKPKVELIDFTGSSHVDPARWAAAVLIYTKNTRLDMGAGLPGDIYFHWDDAQMQAELEAMARTIPSSWEFVDYTFRITGVTRAFTHQFVRTRTGSYAQQTMRIVDKGDFDCAAGPTIEQDSKDESIYAAAVDEIAATYKQLVESGVAIEDARGLLPTNITTNIVAKFSLRTLTEMAAKRSGPRTQGEYRKVLEQMVAAVEAAHPFTAVFFERDLFRACSELDELVIAAVPDAADRVRILKLIDEVRRYG